LLWTFFFKFAQKFTIGRICWTLGGFSSFGTYSIISYSIRQIWPEHDFFAFVVFLDKFIKYWQTFGYVHFFIDCKTGFEKHWYAYAAFIESQSKQNLRWELGLANKLGILCCRQS
jgi:hypothetical protein